MHPLEKNTLKIVQQEDLLHEYEKVIIAVSGGPDSMALLHVLANLAAVLNITLAAVYVNHGLRPDEAEKENQLVEIEANRLGINFFSGSVDVKGLAARKKISLEHAARILRYDFLEKTARECGSKKIALAHTADDQAEEILLRLIRGTARKGLSGMKTIRADKFIRPFLRFSKSRLFDYLEKYSIPFLLDSSNTQDIYLRNRIRNDLLPYIAKRYNPDIRRTLVRTATILQDEEELLKEITEAAFAETASTIQETLALGNVENTQLDKTFPQGLQLNLKLFNIQPQAIQRRLLEKCCWLMDCEPRSRQIEHLLHLAMPGSPAGSLHLSDGLRVMKNKEQLNFVYPRGRGPLRGNLRPDKAIELSETRIPAPGSYEFPEVNKRLLVEDIEFPLAGSGTIFPTGEYIDSALFSFPLTLRSPKTGDRFHPLGAPGSKKISDFLSDQKIEKDLRPLTPVLCVDDTVIALPGLRIDHRFRVTEKTTHIIRVSWEEMESEAKGETKPSGKLC